MRNVIFTRRIQNPATEASGPPTSVETYRDAVNFLQKAILSGAEKEGIRRRKLCYFTKGGLFVYAEHIKNNELSLVEIVKYLNGVRKVEKPLSVNSEKICEFDAKLGALATFLENQDEKSTDSEAIKVFCEAILFKLQNTRFLLEVYSATDKCHSRIKSINDSAENVDKMKYILGDLAHCSDELTIIFAEWEECVTKMTKNDNLESNCKNYSTQEVAEETQASSDPSRCYKIILFQVDAIKKARQLLSKVFDALNNLSIDLIDYNFTTELTESMKLIMSSLTASARVFERDVAKYVKTKNDHSSEENTRADMEEFHESLCITVVFYLDVLQEGLIAYNRIISSYKSNNPDKEPAVFDYRSAKESITETFLKMFETIRPVTGRDIPEFFEESFDEESEKPTIKTPLTFFDTH